MSASRTPGPPTPGGDPPARSAARAGDPSNHTPEDLSDVLVAAARGDESAWRTLVARYARRVFALTRSRVKSPELAEEVTQSVLATVASMLGTGGYTEQGRFESWLFRVAMNRVRDVVRRASRQAVAMDPASMPTPAFDPSQGVPATDPRAIEALRSALDALPDPDREIIELRHHGQMSFKDMADLLDEPLGTLLARHHRALRKLRAMLSPELSADDTPGAALAPEESRHARSSPSSAPRGATS